MSIRARAVRTTTPVWAAAASRTASIGIARRGGLSDKALIVVVEFTSVNGPTGNANLNGTVTCRFQRLSGGVVTLAVTLWCALAAPAAAQSPDPGPIGPFIVDFHGLFLPFPGGAALSDSRGLTQTELPGLGLGAGFGVHVYPVTWGAMTLGLGGRLAVGRSTHTPLEAAPASERSVSERFLSVSPQVSFNFGKGDGWSYLSGGIGRTIWSIVPDDAAKTAADEERLKTIDYGGGARWFIRPHVAFSFDVRFYAINPGTPTGGLPGSPRTTFMVAGAGVSVK